MKANIVIQHLEALRSMQVMSREQTAKMVEAIENGRKMMYYTPYRKGYFDAVLDFYKFVESIWLHPDKKAKNNIAQLYYFYKDVLENNKINYLMENGAELCRVKYPTNDKGYITGCTVIDREPLTKKETMEVMNALIELSKCGKIKSGEE